MRGKRGGTHTQHKGEEKEEEEEKTNKQIASVSKSMLKQKKEKTEKSSYRVLKRKDRALFFVLYYNAYISRDGRKTTAVNIRSAFVE
jgi:hypothetical protein